MKYIIIDQTASDIIASSRYTQTAEFSQGSALAQFINDETQDYDFDNRLKCQKNKDGVAIIGRGTTLRNYIVIDNENCKLFNKFSPNEVLRIFQKILRFGLKKWNKISFGSHERYINDSRVALFPFPISQMTHFRIIIDLEPDSKRATKRPGEHLFVTHCGKQDDLGQKVDAPITNFRKAIGYADSIQAAESVNPRRSPQEDLDSFKHTSIGYQGSHLSPYQGYESWLIALTETQKKFVLSKMKSPHRLEGPAGTGKTLCLILKCIHELVTAHKLGNEHHSVIIAHSESTKKNIEEILTANIIQLPFISLKREHSIQSVHITTLQGLCGELLTMSITETEFLDNDAMTSKGIQSLYIRESLDSVIDKELNSYKHFLSNEFYQYIITEDRDIISDLLQHEISILIKGRAEEDKSKYTALERFEYGLPVKTDPDRSFVFLVYLEYQRQLQLASQFDTDDIILSASAQLNTPLWRRRRLQEGYDSIFIDETHLFNMNELSMFHYLSKSQKEYPIAFTIDKSQAIGDHGWHDNFFVTALTSNNVVDATKTSITSIFRCSSEIVELAFAVMSSGASLFTNFDNPLEISSSTFTAQEEKLCADPLYYETDTDEELVQKSFELAAKISKDLDVTKSEVLIVAFDDSLFNQIEKYATKHNKPLFLLKNRGDIELKERASKSGAHLLSKPDYVGGLEFAAVILVGVDKGRVPPTKDQHTIESRAFLKYAYHNRLYVAVTRAKYRVAILGTKDRGPSELLNTAVEKGILKVVA
ncbi:UvrD-helicase domain-containing protein [Pseudodesulfovibrio indicus]|uniref:UvrD/REP helicase N-terminal domain-containing protein n=1 Tax=Pseudodesulfovibrio indicus TaxID=1716143 RepID=A0AA94TKG2_9BACT|nr:UvrD-helicase domain-containing protein [Pseudodesulfovibrio indicus]TDT88631.1 UvrD/REP helicase N-terminal domain-containing protein [Pseudodesulfovibrio indicus]